MSTGTTVKATSNHVKRQIPQKKRKKLTKTKYYNCKEKNAQNQNREPPFGGGHANFFAIQEEGLLLKVFRHKFSLYKLFPI